MITTTSGNVSVWRGYETPPTNYHQWIKEDADGNYLGTFLYFDDDWIELSASTISIANVIFVDGSSQQDTEDGTIVYPYKSIRTALDTHGSNTIYRIAPGTYDQSPLNFNFLTNVEFTTWGKNPNSVIIGDQVVIVNSTIKFSNIKFTSQVAISGTSTVAPGSIYFDDCEFAGAINNTGTPFVHISNCLYSFSGIINCTASGITVIKDCRFTGANFAYNLQGAGDKIFDSCINLTLRLNSTTGFSDVHIYNTNFLTRAGVDASYPIISTVNAQANIWLNSGGTTQPDGTLAPIQLRSPGITYSLGAFIFEPATSDFTDAVRVDNGIHSLQVYDHKNRTGYTKVSDTLEGHLDGISNKFDEIDQLIEDALIEFQYILYVDINSTKTNEDGSLAYPYKTIQAAIDHIPTSNTNYYVIKVAPGIYDEAITVSKSYVSLEGETGASLSGATVQRISTLENVTEVYIKNLNISNRLSVGSIGVGLTSVQYYKNCTFLEFSCITPSQIAGALTLYIDNCKVTRLFSVGTGSFQSTTSYINNCDLTSTSSYAYTGQTIIRNSTITSPSFAFGNNTYKVYNTTFVSSATPAIIATTNSGVLHLISGNVVNSANVLQPIQIGAGVTYSIGTFQFEASTSTLSGTRIEDGLHSIQVYDHNVRSGYAQSDDTIKGHLDGISDKFDQIDLEIDALEVQTDNIVFVNPYSTRDTEDGSLTHPYKTVQAAYNNRGTKIVIYLFPGNAGPLSITGNITSALRFTSQASSFAAEQTTSDTTTSVIESFSTSGTGNTWPIHFDNIWFNTRITEVTNNPLYFTSCYFGGGIACSNGTSEFYNCAFEADVAIQTTSTIARFFHCDFRVHQLYVTNANFIIIRNAHNLALNVVAGANGAILIYDSYFYPSSDSTNTQTYPIYIAANHNIRQLDLYSGSTQRLSTSDTQKYPIFIGPSTYVGGTSVTFGSFAYEEQNSIIGPTGITIRESGLHVSNIYDHNTYSVISSNNNSLSEELQSIDLGLYNRPTEAPNDGAIYGRMNGTWQQVGQLGSAVIYDENDNIPLRENGSLVGAGDQHMIGLSQTLTGTVQHLPDLQVGDNIGGRHISALNTETKSFSSSALTGQSLTAYINGNNTLGGFKISALAGDLLIVEIFNTSKPATSEILHFNDIWYLTEYTVPNGNYVVTENTMIADTESYWTFQDAQIAQVTDGILDVGNTDNQLRLNTLNQRIQVRNNVNGTITDQELAYLSDLATSGNLTQYVIGNSTDSNIIGITYDATSQGYTITYKVVNLANGNVTDKTYVIPIATTTQSGLLTGTDKAKIDSLETSYVANTSGTTTNESVSIETETFHVIANTGTEDGSINLQSDSHFQLLATNTTTPANSIEMIGDISEETLSLNAPLIQIAENVGSLTNRKAYYNWDGQPTTLDNAELATIGNINSKLENYIINGTNSGIVSIETDEFLVLHCDDSLEVITGGSAQIQSANAFDLTGNRIHISSMSDGIHLQNVQTSDKISIGSNGDDGIEIASDNGDIDLNTITGTANYNGSEITTVSSDNSGIIYVNGSYTGTVETGSSFQPYKTIQAAIDAVGSYVDILIAHGTYNEDIEITGKTGITLKALSPIGNRPNIEITGGLTIDDSSTRIGIHGLSFDGESTLDSTGSNDYYQFVNFNDAVTLQGTGYSSFRTCWFNGLTWSAGNVEMNTCYDENGSAWQLGAADTYTFGCRNGFGLIINHSNGNVDIVDTYFAKDSSSQSIYSSAGSGRLIITGGSLQQLDGSYGGITKTGVCQYALGTLVHEEQGQTLFGTRIDSGLHGNQIYMHSSTPGYTRRPGSANGSIATDSLNAHLLGISDQFLSIAGASNNIVGSVATAGDSIDLTIGDSGIILRLVYQSATVVNLYALTSSGTVTCDIRRSSIYGDSSQGSTFDNTAFTTTPTLLDDVLNNSSDTCTVWIGTDTAMYEAKIFVSNAGARVRMVYTKLI